MIDIKELFDEFEKLNDIPDHIIRCGNGYASTSYNDWSGVKKKFEGFKQGYEAGRTSEWVSVEDKLPDHEELVLIKVKLAFTRPIEIIETKVTGMLDDDGWKIGNDLIAWDYDFNCGDIEVTHWMSPPE